MRPLNLDAIMGNTHTEMGADGFEYKVHHIVHGAKQYICPGCNGVIMVGEAHEVAWTEENWFGVAAGQADRRHWHTSCWRARGRAR
ncbi:ATP/GTP-binding protein [Arcanobacterium hippocoleae]|nr:ATP/GTP-binding protein [Arcanobacterium hippocoleae]